MAEQRRRVAAARVAGLLRRQTASLVRREHVVGGHLGGLLGLLYALSGLCAAIGLSLGTFDQGEPWAIVVLAVVAVTCGSGMMLFLRNRRLPNIVTGVLVILGGFVVAIGVLVGGSTGGPAVAVLFVYAVCFAVLALPPGLLRTLSVLLPAAAHLAVLALVGMTGWLGAWVLVWGTALVTGGLVALVTRGLRDTVAGLETAGVERDLFVAMVSHELRTPLTGILGAAETLLRHEGRLTSAERHTLLDVIGRHAARQQRLIDEVLTISSLGAGRSVTTPRAVAVGRVVETAAEHVGGCTVEVSADLRAMVDPGHLLQVLDNLLTNAHRYGRPPVVVRAGVDDGWCRIDVTDHGPGLPLDFDELVEPFVQGDVGDRPTSSGFGLGLTICRELVAANGGRLWAVSTRCGTVTVVAVRLPLADLDEHDTAHPPLRDEPVAGIGSSPSTGAG